MMIGSPAATTDPKAISRMINAARNAGPFGPPPDWKERRAQVDFEAA